MNHLKAHYMDKDVHEAALERILDLYKRFDTVVVSFSGGKDSTVCLQLALEAAEQAGRLPAQAFFYDEEAIVPETVEYCERVRARSDVNLRWLCTPIQHRNACSRHEPYWYPWDEDKKSIWCRDMPPYAEHLHDGFRYGMGMPVSSLPLYGDEYGSVVHIRGMRADESMRRRGAVTRREHDNYLSGPYRPRWSKKQKSWEVAQGGNTFVASPIYDWTTPDVWVAPKLFDWDYNRAYDVMDAIGLTPHQQRVAPPFGEEPLNNLHMFAKGWPQLWDAMIERVDGASTAGRYALTELYGAGGLTLPEGLTWQEWALKNLQMYPPEWRSKVADVVRRVLNRHKTKTNGRPIPETEPDPISGLSWRFICLMIFRGDFKGRKQQALLQEASKAMKGRSLEELLDELTDEGTRY